MGPRAKSGPSRRLVGLYATLFIGNAGAWLWAVEVCRGRPILMGAALLAYVLGLRHAVDADHIAAIDNVTRRLATNPRRPLTVGLWFSLGHSTVVVLACGAIAILSATFRSRFAHLSEVGGAVGTGISASFLFAIALANVVALRPIWRAFRASRGVAEAPVSESESQAPVGLLVRLLSPVLRLVARPWHMYPLGFLFGLGFDTATEVGLLAIAAGQASHGLPLWSIMVFPALFTAGMSLVDTTDGVLMAGAYGWAFVQPARRLVYNLVVTLVSIAIAVVVGAVEILGLIAGKLSLDGVFWRRIIGVTDHFSLLGALIIASLAGLWLASILAWRFRRPVAAHHILVGERMGAAGPSRSRGALSP